MEKYKDHLLRQLIARAHAQAPSEGKVAVGWRPAIGVFESRRIKRIRISEHFWLGTNPGC